MKPPRQPLFVAPHTYRRRRLMDAARMLPVLGLALVLLPLLWTPEAGGLRSTALDGIYLFLVWGGLIGAARLLAPGLDTARPDTRDQRES